MWRTKWVGPCNLQIYTAAKSHNDDDPETVDNSRDHQPLIPKVLEFTWKKVYRKCLMGADNVFKEQQITPQIPTKMLANKTLALRKCISILVPFKISSNPNASEAGSRHARMRSFQNLFSSWLTLLRSCKKAWLISSLNLVITLSSESKIIKTCDKIQIKKETCTIIYVILFLLFTPFLFLPCVGFRSRLIASWSLRTWPKK